GDLGEEGSLLRTQPEKLGGALGLRLLELHLAQEGGGQEDRRVAADLLRDRLPGEPLLALGLENFRGELGSRHLAPPIRRSAGPASGADASNRHATAEGAFLTARGSRAAGLIGRKFRLASFLGMKGARFCKNSGRDHSARR